MKVVTKVKFNDWNNFLDHTPSTVYHTPQWKMLLEKVFSYSPVYLFALNDSGYITGFLPLFRVKGFFSGTRLCAIPFGHICGAIGSMEAKNFLISKALELVDGSFVESLEIREFISSPFFKVKNSFLSSQIVIESHHNETQTRKPFFVINGMYKVEYI